MASALIAILALNPFMQPSSSLKTSKWLSNMACSFVGGAACRWCRDRQSRPIFCSQLQPRRLGPLPATTSRGSVCCCFLYCTSTVRHPCTSSSSPVYVHSFRVDSCNFRRDSAHSFMYVAWLMSETEAPLSTSIDSFLSIISRVTMTGGGADLSLMANRL